jgi:hypothetical protein
MKMTDEPDKFVPRESFKQKKNHKYVQRLRASRSMSGGTEWLMANMVGGATTGSIGGVQSGVGYFGWSIFFLPWVAAHYTKKPSAISENISFEALICYGVENGKLVSNGYIIYHITGGCWPCDSRNLMDPICSNELIAKSSLQRMVFCAVHLMPLSS